MMKFKFVFFFIVLLYVLQLEDAYTLRNQMDKELLWVEGPYSAIRSKLIVSLGAPPICKRNEFIDEHRICRPIFK